MTFLSQRLGPFPVWVWGVVLIGGVVVVLVVKRMQNGTTTNASGVLGQNSAGQVNPLNPSNDPNIDPNTGVPYQIEEAVDPNTGMPYYFQLTGGATSQGQAGGGSNGSTTPPSSGGGPSTCPPGYHWQSVGPAFLSTPGGSSAPTGQGQCVPDQPVPVDQPIPLTGRPMPVQAATLHPSTMQPLPAASTGAPARGTGASGEWEYPFWTGQGGRLYA